MSRTRAFVTLASLVLIWTAGCDQGNVPSAPDMSSVPPTADTTASPQTKGRPPADQKSLGSSLAD